MNDSTATVNQTLTFTAAGSTGQPVLTYSWDFGDASGVTPFTTSVTSQHAYATAGNYTATLTVKDGLSFTDTDDVAVSVSGGGTSGVFCDSFDRDNNTILGSDPNCPGTPAWSEAVPSFEIISHQLKNTVSGTNIAVLSGITGTTQVAEADFTSVNNNPSPRLGVVLRYVNQTNYYVFYRLAGPTSALRISKVVGGTETVLATKAIPQPVANVPFHLKATAGQTAAGQTAQTLTVTLGPPQTPIATLSIADASLSAGDLGVFVSATQTFQYGIDNFSGTNN